MARHGAAWHGMAWQGRRGKAWLGTAWHGQAGVATNMSQSINRSEQMQVQIKRPNMAVSVFRIIGTVPYVQARFTKKAELMEGMGQGQPAKNKRKREPRDYAKEFEDAQHKMPDGRRGIPASALRNALISACRVAGYAMTKAKLSVFIEADGFDVEDGTPLVAIEGTPEPIAMHVRNSTGVTDVRVRAMWREWSASVAVRYDADQFAVEDIANLLARAGMQVGIGEGRPDSRESAGMGWGLFKVE